MVLLSAVLLAELVHTATGVDHLLLAGKEGMACRTYVQTQVMARGGLGLKGITAAAVYGNLAVFRVDIRFHFDRTSCKWLLRRYVSPRYAPRRHFKEPAIVRESLAAGK